MAGFYIHIPFCKQACSYCDFHFSTNRKSEGEILALMRDEIGMRSTEIEGEVVESIYFGGGTPSIIDQGELSKLIDKILELNEVSADVEVTLEANPDDIEQDKLLGWKEAGVNRLSIGIQSLNDNVLKWMNRTHTADEGKRSIQMALDQGFETSTIDLIYGMPEMMESEWIETLEFIAHSGINHLSAYNLTVEQGTLLAHRINKGDQNAPDDKTGREHFKTLREYMGDNGWDHYEVSNFAKPGFRSRHNSNYWNRIPYIGIGPGAHSFTNNTRRWNVASNQLYLKQFNSGGKYFEEEELSRTNRINEIIMLGLRKREGIELQKLKEESYDLLIEQQEYLQKAIDSGRLEMDAEHLRATSEGLYFADRIASDLFLVS